MGWTLTVQAGRAVTAWLSRQLRRWPASSRQARPASQAWSSPRAVTGAASTVCLEAMRSSSQPVRTLARHRGQVCSVAGGLSLGAGLGVFLRAGFFLVVTRYSFDLTGSGST